MQILQDTYPSPRGSSHDSDFGFLEVDPKYQDYKRQSRNNSLRHTRRGSSNSSSCHFYPQHSATPSRSVQANCSRSRARSAKNSPVFRALNPHIPRPMSAPILHNPDAFHNSREYRKYSPSNNSDFDYLNVDRSVYRKLERHRGHKQIRSPRKHRYDHDPYGKTFQRLVNNAESFAAESHINRIMSAPNLRPLARRNPGRVSWNDLQRLEEAHKHRSVSREPRREVPPVEPGEPMRERADASLSKNEFGEDVYWEIFELDSYFDMVCNIMPRTIFSKKRETNHPNSKWFTYDVKAGMYVRQQYSSDPIQHYHVVPPSDLTKEKFYGY